MIFSSKAKFDVHIHELLDESGSKLYLIMRTGYSFKEMLEDTWTIEEVELIAAGAEDRCMWFNDWYEGQQYIELYDYYREEELLELLLHTRRINEDELTE